MTGEKKDGTPSRNGDVDTQLVASRYEIQELLGRGSMGAVYCARDVVLDRPVALKLFPADTTDPRDAARYEHEARLLARLSHPGLVTVYDAGIDATVADQPRPYLVMELVRGSTLADRLRVGPLPAPETAALAGQLASALAHIHRREVVHRDVKPANIILRADEATAYPSATLTDFGIARLIDGTRMTMTGFTVGTANYLSPEQLTGGDVGPPSDIYSLGLVLLECLTGQIAYPGHGAEAAMPRLQGSPVIPESLPDGWRELLEAMTRLEPAARPAAAEITTYLGGLTDAPTSAIQLPAAAAPDESDADHTRVLSVSDMAPAIAPPGPRRHLLRPGLVIAALVAALVLIFVIAYVASGNSGSAPPTNPQYPSVGGQLGDHLRQLQQDVAP